MAKGQKRSGREAKKPKKSAADKLKAGAGSAYKEAMSGKSSIPPLKKP